MGMQFAELRLKLRLKLKFMTLFYIIIVLLAAVVLNIIWEKLTNEDEQEYTEPDEEPESESLPMVSNEDNPIATTTPRRQTSLDDTAPLTQKIKPLLEELGFQYEEHENGDILFSYEGYTFVCQHTSDPGIINIFLPNFYEIIDSNIAFCSDIADHINSQVAAIKAYFIKGYLWLGVEQFVSPEDMANPDFIGNLIERLGYAAHTTKRYINRYENANENDENENENENENDENDA